MDSDVAWCTIYAGSVFTNPTYLYADALRHYISQQKTALEVEKNTQTERVLEDYSFVFEQLDHPLGPLRVFLSPQVEIGIDHRVDDLRRVDCVGPRQRDRE